MNSIIPFWSTCAGLIVLFMMSVGRTTKHGWFGILVDARGRYSLSHLQVVLWTIVVVSLVCGVVLARILAHSQDAMAFTIPDELLAVMGLSVATSTVSTVIKNTKDTTDASSIAVGEPSPQGRTGVRWIQVVMVEEGEQADRIIDIGKFQALLFTITLILAYVAHAVGELQGMDPRGKVELPGFSGTFLTLLAMSHVGYLTSKIPTRAGKPEGLSLEKMRQGPPV